MALPPPTNEPPSGVWPGSVTLGRVSGRRVSKPGTRTWAPVAPGWFAGGGLLGLGLLAAVVPGAPGVPSPGPPSVLELGKATAARAFVELQRKGFLELVKRGRWYGRLASEWRVTDRIYQGHPPTHDWKRWQPDRHPRKSKLGSVVDHIDSTTGPLQHRETASWSATEPVKAVSTDTIGAEAGRLYTNVARGGVCLEQGRRAEPAGERSAPTDLRPIANVLGSILPPSPGTRAAINSRKS